MKRLIILGASGHGKVVADIAKLNGYEEIVFVDDDITKKECAGFPVIGNSDEAPEGELFVAIGNAIVRKKFVEQYRNRKQPVLIHPNAVIASDVRIGNGTVVMAGVVVNPGTVIGEGSILNTCCSIDHDCIIHDYVHVSVGAHLCGSVVVEESTWIGAGVTISNNITVCSNCLIGIGAVVIKDIDCPGVYIGLPAKKL